MRFRKKNTNEYVQHPEEPELELSYFHLVLTGPTGAREYDEVYVAAPGKIAARAFGERHWEEALQDPDLQVQVDPIEVFMVLS